MRWVRAFLLGVLCLVATAAACSGTEFSAAPDPDGGTPSQTSTGGGTAGSGQGGSSGTGGTTDGGSGCKTCADLRTECGNVPNGCGDIFDCGRCQTGQKCQLGHCVGQAYCGN